MIKFWSALAGYKTYIMAFAYGIDAGGVHLGWWEADTLRVVMEQVFTILALRSGMPK